MLEGEITLFAEALVEPVRPVTIEEVVRLATETQDRRRARPRHTALRSLPRWALFVGLVISMVATLSAGVAIGHRTRVAVEPLSGSKTSTSLRTVPATSIVSFGGPTIATLQIRIVLGYVSSCVISAANPPADATAVLRVESTGRCVSVSPALISLTRVPEALSLLPVPHQPLVTLFFSSAQRSVLKRVLARHVLGSFSLAFVSWGRVDFSVETPTTTPFPPEFLLLTGASRRVGEALIHDKSSP
jgi:hypothetical protein